MPESEAATAFGAPLLPARMDASDSGSTVTFGAAEVKKEQTKMTVKGVPAGKYRAARGKSSADVEVTAGKSVKVTLVATGRR